MDKYFKERMDEIQLRTEQITERKTYESEIDSLEEKLKGLESNYQRLKTTWKSNIEESALKRVDLVVVKETRAFAEDVLSKNQALLIEEKRKLDDLHRQVWEEEIKACDEIGKCVADNDSVSFLNEYPRILKMHKFPFLTTPESDDEIKQLVAGHPEVKQLAAEIAALETEIKKAEDNCLETELEKVLNEIKELNSNDYYNGDETEKLIKALENSHRERLSLEKEIADMENRRIEASHVEAKLQNMSQTESKDFPRVKNEPLCYSSEISLVSDKKPFKTRLETYRNYESQVIKEKDKKIQARKWYEEYVREIAVTDEENYSKNLYSPANHGDDDLNISKQGMARISSSKNCSFSSKLARFPSSENASLKRKDKDQDGDEYADVPPIKTFKFHPKIGAKRKSSDHSSLPIKSRFFDEENQNPSPVVSDIFPTSTPKSNLNPKKRDADVKSVSEKTPKASRKLEPLVATPSTFFKSAAETAFDNKLVQSGYGEGPSTSAQNVTNVKSIVKFTPKRPSNISKKTAYRQTKLDDFDNFMLGDKK